jgi:hypothetical protein
MGRDDAVPKESGLDSDGLEVNGEYEVVEDLTGLLGEKEDDIAVNGLDDEFAESAGSCSIAPSIVGERRKGRGARLSSVATAAASIR